MDEEVARDAVLLDSIVEVERRIAAAEAERALLMAEFVAVRRAQPAAEGAAARRARVVAGQFAADEIGAAVCWSTGRVQAEVARVGLLATRLPRVLGLWSAGRLDGYRVGKITDAARRLVDPDSFCKLDERAAETAVGKTATQLGSWCARFVAKTEPDQVQRRHTRAVAERRVETSLEPDGMGSVWGLLNAVDTAAIDTRLTRLARGLGAEDPRSMDQRRADVFVDLLLGCPTAEGTTVRGGAGGAAAVVVTVPVQSLLGFTDDAGELGDRSASIPACLVRQVAARPGTLFYRALTDPQGHVLDVTELGRFPSELLGFAVDIRDGTCRWSTCTARASGCDANHSPPWPAGHTRADDLVDQCRRHHNGVTHAGFGIRQPGPGTVQWTTPTGHTYTVNAEPLPVQTWWPTPRSAPCGCDACDTPHLSDTELAAMLPSDVGLGDLSAEELLQLAGDFDA